jgi:hypothetical protein
VGDKSPKSKERGQKQKNVAKATGSAKLADKQASYTSVTKPAKGR